MNRKVATDQASPQKFAPHGRFQYETLDDAGNLLHIQCVGPFNEELVTAIKEVQKHPDLLNPNRKEVFEFTHSCMGIPKFVEEATVYVGQLKQESKAPRAVALVMPQSLQGSNLMRDTYLNIYKQFDIQVNAFESVAEAIEWLNSL